jgi:hypothetical protein
VRKPGARRGPIFGEARLPNSPMILRKLLICLNPASGYTNMLAEPRYNVWHGEGRYAGIPDNHSRRNLDASNPADPRLGTRIGLAPRWHPPTSIASQKFSGRTGASPHQKCGPSPHSPPSKTYSRREPRRQVLSPAEGIRFIWRR